MKPFITSSEAPSNEMLYMEKGLFWEKDKLYEKPLGLLPLTSWSSFNGPIAM